MDFGGKYLFTAPRLAVWQALNDTEVLKAAIPGCQRIDWVGEQALEAAISVNLGVAHPVFVGDLLLSHVVPAKSYTLTGKGRGGILGRAQGAAEINLDDAGANCTLLFSAQGQASNTLMKLGSALIGKSAQGVIDRFFERFAAAMQVKVTPLDR